MNISDISEIIGCNNYYINQYILFQSFINAYNKYYGEYMNLYPDYKLFHIYQFAYQVDEHELKWMPEKHLFIGYRKYAEKYVPFFLIVSEWDSYNYDVVGFSTYDETRWFDNYKDLGLMKNYKFLQCPKTEIDFVKLDEYSVFKSLKEISDKMK